MLLVILQIRIKADVWSDANADALIGEISTKHLVRSEPSSSPDWPKTPHPCCPRGNHSVPPKSYGNLVNEQVQIKIHKAASRQHMNWIAAWACCSLSLYSFFLKDAICLSDIYCFLISADLWVFVFCVQNVLQPRPLSFPFQCPLCLTSSLIFYAFCLSFHLAFFLASLFHLLSLPASVRLFLSLDSFAITVLFALPYD